MDQPRRNERFVRRRLGFQLVAALLTVACALSAFGARAEGGGPADLVEQAGSSVIAAPVSVAPTDLYHALAAAPLTAAELPAGFSPGGDPQDISSEITGAAPGAVGALILPVSGGSGGVPAVAFAVFDNAADASTTFNQSPGFLPDLQVSDSETPSGFDSPAILYDGAITIGGFGLIGASLCAVLVDNVIVAGVSIQPGNPAGGSADDACTLAHAGEQHLSTVIAANS